MANIAYVRVSTVDQNEARQIEALGKYNIDKWFSEKVSGKDTNRPQLQAMLDYIREGDTVFIHDFSRLARSTKDLLNLVDLLESKHVRLVSNKESLDTSTPTGRLMLTMIAAINEFERENIKERQREGVQLAKQRGAYKGRKKIQIDNFGEYYDRYMHRELNIVQMAKELNVSRTTIYKLMKEYEEAKPDAANSQKTEF